jgi:hypothetical protein
LSFEMRVGRVGDNRNVPEREVGFMTYESSLIFEEKASLVQSDSLLSFQFLNAYGGGTQQEPERMLMLAVLEDAVTCIQKYASISKGRGKRWFREPWSGS